MFLFILLQGAPSFELSALTLMPDLGNPQQLVMVAMAIIVFVLSWVMPMFLLKKTNFKKEGIPSLSSEPLSVPDLIKKTFVPLILRFAMLESVSLFGFILATQSQTPAKMLPFLALSVLSYFRSFPSEVYLRKLAGEN